MFPRDVKMGLIIFLFLSGVLVICDGIHVLGPSGPLIVELGGSVMMPCYVENPIPLDELEVEWKRADSETLVHLFQDGESQPVAQDPAYSGRASFITEEVQRGNFSLLLTNLTTKDAGVYRCSVYKQRETGQTSAEIKEIEYLIVTGGRAVSAYARYDVTLNCSVVSHIPPENLEEVTWKKVDQETIVLVFQEGVVQTEFTHDRFRDRVEFFGPEEIHKGNFSLRLKDLQVEDKGLYRCEVHSGELSANTTVKILPLGYSHIHNMILFLCGFTCLCGSSLLIGCITCTFHNACNEPDKCTMIIQHVLVFGPNILMFVAFVLWSFLGGLLSEAVTCLTINLLRVLRPLLFYPRVFQDNVQKLIKMSAVLEFMVLSAIAYVVLALYAWGIQDKALMGFFGAALALSIIIFFVGILCLVLPDKITLLLMKIWGFLWVFYFFLNFLIVVFVFSIPELREANGSKGVICLIVLSMCILALVFVVTKYYDRKRPTVKSNQQVSQQPLTLMPKLCALGVAVLFIVNSVTLAVDLIKQAGEGERTVEDLRLIILPFEMVFAIVCATSFCCQPQRQHTTLPRRRDNTTTVSRRRHNTSVPRLMNETAQVAHDVTQPIRLQRISKKSSAI